MQSLDTQNFHSKKPHSVIPREALGLGGKTSTAASLEDHDTQSSRREIHAEERSAGVNYKLILNQSLSKLHTIAQEKEIAG